MLFAQIDKNGIAFSVVDLPKAVAGLIPVNGWDVLGKKLNGKDWETITAPEPETPPNHLEQMDAKLDRIEAKLDKLLEGMGK